MSAYEVVLCIVNAGYSDTVMDAAKEVGARGGTIIHARGTANKEAEKYFHITIQPDKEMVMILVPSEIKDAVLHAIYRDAGLKSAGQGIAFSMPVDDVVGISSPVAAPEKTDGKKEDEAVNGESEIESNGEKADENGKDDPNGSDNK